MFGPVHAIGGALQFYPAFAGRGFHAQVALQSLKITAVTVEELLGDASILEMKSFCSHRVLD
jgi:hypothetical protein